MSLTDNVFIQNVMTTANPYKLKGNFYVKSGKKIKRRKA